MKTLKELVAPNVDRVLNCLEFSVFKTSKEIAAEVGITVNKAWLILRYLERTGSVSFRMRKIGTWHSMEYSLRQVRP